ncbi:OmpA family protein [Paucibacter sp. O1-1]|nr:OmpA family protein [Paucibacter sp. O1-1]MDA3825021.1 OmpA family protein [Paucibacter sp. O1-1]
MTRRSHLSPWRPGAAAACLAIAACAITPLPPPSPPPVPAVQSLARLAQRGHGGNAAFELCQGEACPQRTPKTLQVSQGSASQSAPTPFPLASAADARPWPEEKPRIEQTAEAARAPVTRPPAPDSPVVEQLAVHFPFASARLDATARATLRAAAPRLAQAQEVFLSGRTDSTGPSTANDRLADARAQSVLRELLALAPDVASNVRVEAQGACCFVESNANSTGRARNRRVEIRYRFDTDDPP